MNDRIKSALTAIRRQLDLPANLRGIAKQLENRFDAIQWDRLQVSIRSLPQTILFLDSDGSALAGLRRAAIVDPLDAVSKRSKVTPKYFSRRP